MKMYNANSLERVTGRSHGILSATPLNLRQERHKPVSVPSTIGIDAGVDT